MGQYVVSPATHLTDCGRFRASFSVQRSQSNGGYCRVFRFDKTLPPRNRPALPSPRVGCRRACPPTCADQPLRCAPARAIAAQSPIHPFLPCVPFVARFSIERHFHEHQNLCGQPALLCDRFQPAKQLRRIRRRFFCQGDDRPRNRPFKGLWLCGDGFRRVAQAAIDALHGMSVDGRTIVVNLARPRESRWRRWRLQRWRFHCQQACRCGLRQWRLRRRPVLIPARGVPRCLYKPALEAGFCLRTAWIGHWALCVQE